MKQVITINIGDTDRNSDWIKTKENRKRQRELHQQLVGEHKEQEVKEDP